MMYKPLSDSTLMGMTKKEIIENLRIAEHNFFAAEETLAQQAENMRDWAPVVHGHWDCIPNQYMAVASKDGKYFGNATVCSVCHEVNPNAYKTNYCPNCGAKMDGRGEDA